MKLFLKYSGEFLSRYPQLKLSHNEEIQIRNSVMNYLGVDNINHLRDRFEGQAFLDRTIKNYGAMLLCQKYLQIQSTDLETINLRDFQPIVEIGDKNFNINVFEFGELPVIDITDKLMPTIFIIQKDKVTFLLSGFAESECIKKHLIESFEVNSSPKKFKKFVGFSELQSIDKLYN